jgi:ABC-type sugar transport system ATPase subunit
MNLVRCAYNSDAGDLASASDGWRLPLPEKLRARVISGKDAGQLILGIRPEDIQLLPQAGNGDLAGQVYVVEPLGDRNIYDIKLGSTLIKVKTQPGLVLEPGSPVSIRFNLERAHLFDATTELTLV